VDEYVKERKNSVSTGVHGHSGVEQGLDGKDLASAYVLHPLEWLSSYFRVGAELSRYRVWVELRSKIKGLRIRDGGGSESELESELEKL
jgi:hypothetical protein